MSQQADILLTTLNARYIHASLGLRYLFANLDALQSRARILEFTTKTDTESMLGEILAAEPKIIGLGIYIWNVTQTTTLISALKQARPEITIIIGGPEVSHEYEATHIFQLADHLITGQADLVFKQLCQQLLTPSVMPDKVINASPPALDSLQLPYRLYDSTDLAHRVIYVEASRGCPFKCEFCLSSLDKTAYPFNLDTFLGEMNKLHERGARSFKFVDRTFNLNVRSCVRILEFFLAKLDDGLFLHFELIPDHLPDALKQLLTRFPPASLQFEIGVQTFSQPVQALINRRQNNDKTKQNIHWLKHNTHAHLHTDLIFGLPGETLASFSSSFNQLVALEPDEIQLGILKRLRGTPMIAHSQPYALKFNQQAPYEIVSTALIDAATLKKVTHFSRFWDRIANSGRFQTALPLMLAGDAFENFMQLSDYLYKTFNRSHSIQLEALTVAIEHYFADHPETRKAIDIDKQRRKSYRKHGGSTRPNLRQSRHLAV